MSKCLRFGIDEVNVLKPDGPNNRDRLVAELNDLLAVAEMLVEYRILPKDWISPDQKAQKKEKVIKFMAYATKIGSIR